MTSSELTHVAFGSAPRRLAFAFVGLAVLLVVYTALNGRFESAFNFMTPLDHTIPLLPWTVPVYGSLYLLAPLTAVICEPKVFARGVTSIFIVALVCFAGFIFLPAAYPRPSLSELDSAWRPMLEWYYANDPPLNTFPSLHVATAAVLAWMLRTVGRWWVWAGWAGLIAVSTLTTKQHFLLDLVGGLVVAAASVGIVELGTRVREHGLQR